MQLTDANGLVSKAQLLDLLRRLERARVATPMDYGAKGDGTTIDGPAVARAIREAPSVFVPPGTYLFDAPQVLQVRGRKVTGVRGASILKHVSEARGAFFVLGNCHPYGFDDRNPIENVFPRITVRGAVVSGSRSLQIEGNKTLGAGQTVWLRDTTDFKRPGWSQPDFAQLCRIAKVDGRVLFLDRPIAVDLESAQINTIEGRDPYLSKLLAADVTWGLCEDVTIEGLTFLGGTEAFSRMGAFRCVLRDIEHWGAADGPLCNAFCESSIHRWHGHYSRRGIEIKMASHDSHLRDVYLSYQEASGYENSGPVPVHPFEFGERSFNVSLENMQVNATADWAGTQALVHFQDVRNYRVVGSRLSIGSGGPGVPVIKFSGQKDRGSKRPPTNITLAFNTVDVQVTKAAGVYFDATDEAPISGVRFVGNTWTGVPLRGDVAFIAQGKVAHVTSIGDALALGNKVRLGNGASPIAITP